MWARGYFCCSSGNVSDEMIKNYIENQNVDDEDTVFKVEQCGFSRTEICDLTDLRL